MLNEKAHLKPIRSYKKHLSQPDRTHEFHDWYDSLKARFEQQDFPLSKRPFLSSQDIPLHIEIGCGQGLHPVRWVVRHPQAGLVALERTKIKFSKFISRLESHKITTVWPVNEDASHWLPAYIAPRTVDCFYFLYPNPYPKESQANKRWHRNPFFEYVLDCLKKDGFVEMASNLPWYIKEAKLYCQEHWGLKLVSEKKLSLSDNYKPQTHFEKKYLLRGEPCTHLIFQKITK